MAEIGAKDQWLSPIMSQKDGKNIYTACRTRHGLRLSTGEHVYLLPADPSIDLFIAKIESMYQDVNSKKMLHVRWYYRSKELRHEPPSDPLDNEIYYTDYFDCQPIDSVYGHCKVLTKKEYCELTARSGPKLTEAVYICEFAYSGDKGTFTVLKAASEDSPKQLIQVLLEIEKCVPLEAVPSSWQSDRPEWILNTKSSTTPEQIAKALLALEVGMHLFHDKRPNTTSCWRKSINEIHSFEALAKHVRYFKNWIFQKLSILPQSCEKKRKRQDRTGIQQYEVESRKSSVRQVNREMDRILPGCFYEVNHTNLPLQYPNQMKAIRVLQVVEKTRSHMTVKFPGMVSLKSFFKPSASPNKGTLMGSRPELDEEFVMDLQVAGQIILRQISCTEYLHQGHLKEFWLVKQASLMESPYDTVDNRNFELECKNEKVASDVENSPKSSNRDGPLLRVCGLTPDTNTRFFLDSVGKDTREHSSIDGNATPQYNGSLELTDFFEEAAETLAQFNNSNSASLSLEDDAGEEPIRWGKRKKVSNMNRIRGHVESAKCYEGAGGSLVKNKADDQTAGHKAYGIQNISILKLPKDMQGRWSSERYKAAQLKLLDIMHERGAAPGKPILRPSLREEARKHIGDTGLLDHLLKHMTDTVICNGERFRRRHNSEGAMEYWLEDAKLLEIRKMAGVNDPFWIPPPGWKPGDEVPEMGGYICKGMSPSEAAEMQELKIEIQDLKREIEQLSRNPEDYLKDQIETLREMKNEIASIRDMQQDLTTQFQTTSSTKNTGLQNVKDQSATQVESSDTRHELESNYSTICQRLDKLESETLAIEVTKERANAEIQFSNLWKAIMSMEEKFACMVNTVGTLQARLTTNAENNPYPTSSSIPVVSPKTPGTCEGETVNHRQQSVNPVSASSTNDAVSPNQLRTSSPSEVEGELWKNSSTSTSQDQKNIRSIQNSLAANQSAAMYQQQHGFKVCRPPGSFVWPSMAKTRPFDSAAFRVEDVLSSHLYAAEVADVTSRASVDGFMNNILSRQQFSQSNNNDNQQGATGKLGGPSFDKVSSDESVVSGSRSNSKQPVALRPTRKQWRNPVAEVVRSSPRKRIDGYAIDIAAKEQTRGLISGFSALHAPLISSSSAQTDVVMATEQNDSPWLGLAPPDASKAAF